MAEIAGVTIYSIIQKVKDASIERHQYLDEVRAVISSLESLPGRLETARKGNSWSRGLLALSEPQKRFVPDKELGPTDVPEGTVERWGRQIDSVFVKLRLDKFVPPEKTVEPKGSIYYDTDLYTSSGILKRMEGLLMGLVEKLNPRTGIKKTGTDLMWYWTEQGVKAQIDEIARLSRHIDSLLARDHFDLSLENHNLARDNNNILKDIQKTQQHEVREKDRAKIMAWLSPLEFYKRQNAVLEDSFRTGRWLFDSLEFQAWVSGRPWTLWCYGDPGAGKTVLCSNVVDHLQRKYAQRDVLVLFMYLDYKEKDKQTPINLVGSLVKQLIQHRHFGFRSKELERMYQASRGEAQPNQNEMIRVLQEEFQKTSRVYLIIDGWNDTTDAVRMQLENLLSELGTERVSAMITSRYAEIESASSEISCTICRASRLSIYYHCEYCRQYDLCSDCMIVKGSCGNESHTLKEPYDQVSVLVKATDDDIRQYVKWEIDQQVKHDESRRRDPRLNSYSFSTTPLARRLEQKPSLRQGIPDQIVYKAKGMYLLARLYIDSLKTMLNVKEIESALLALPEDLDMVYAEKMERIVSQRPKRKADWARKALCWIVCTQRPLSFKELQHALGVEAGETTYDPEEEVVETDIISTTAGLVTIDFDHRDDKRAVRIHVTFDDYLQEHRSQWFHHSDLDIARTILTYLNFDGLESPCREDQMEERLKQLPLLSYGSQYWGDHVSRVCSEPEIYALLLKFLSSPGKLDSCLQAAFYIGSKIYSDIDARKGVNGLHVAALYGLDPVIPDLVTDNGIPIDSIDPTYEQTALMYAARKGHLSTVTKLLNLGASVNIRSARETTAFLEACLRACCFHQARYCSRAGYCLQSSCCLQAGYCLQANYLQAGDVYVQIAKLFLNREDLDVNLSYVNEQNRTALMIAADFGSEDLVRLILQRSNIDTNHRDDEGCTALFLAAVSQNDNIVELLINHPSIDIDMPNKVGSSPLIIAARSGYTDIVDQLLSKGADHTIHDREGGGTALLRAVDEGYTDVIKVFLDHKIDFQSVDDSGRGLLHGASVNGHDEVVSQLLEAGLDINAQGQRGETPLHDASHEGYYDVAKVLLDARADHTIKDKLGRTPAEVARQNGHDEVVQLLEGIENGTEPLQREPYTSGESLPIWALAKRGLLDHLRERIAHADLDLSEQNPDTGDSALHYAVTNDQQVILKLLLEAKVSPDCVNHVQRTPLHLAAFNNRLECTDILLGSNPKPQLSLLDAWGMTPLVTAQNRQSFLIAVVLIDAGAEIDESNRSHIQPTFFAAVELRNTKVVELLIAKGADHLRLNAEGISAKYIARTNHDIAMLRTLDTHKSDYFAFRSASQRSDDYVSATSSPYTPSLTSPPNVASPSSIVSQSLGSTPANLESLASPGLAKLAPRPRPSVIG